MKTDYTSKLDFKKRVSRMKEIKGAIGEWVDNNEDRSRK